MASDSDLSKIQAVKELIFGQEIQNYDTEFKEINARSLKNEEKSKNDYIALNNAISNLEKSVSARIDRLEADLNKKLALLDDKKTDRAKLGKMLIQIGEKLQDQ
ncbi:hypothetical protein [Crocinitomix catalasitica]|uniref:hypothetical protein n=1 Tax=Crocinitomix catalasitica TaxID=184607 RepID=UPI00048607D9|nr:hypothetical protein [Crocinitomix catalasitica]